MIIILTDFLDIDECLRPDACGNNAICRNTPGNYTCDCQPGFVGNPYDGVIIIPIYYNIIIILIYLKYTIVQWTWLLITRYMVIQFIAFGVIKTIIIVICRYLQVYKISSDRIFTRTRAKTNSFFFFLYILFNVIC